jgi:hypothetical protein
MRFPDINKSPTEQGIAPPCKNTPIPGVPEVPGAVPRTTTCLTPPRPVLACTSSDGTEKNQSCKDEGQLTLERSKTVDEESSAKVNRKRQRSAGKWELERPDVKGIVRQGCAPVEIEPVIAKAVDVLSEVGA